MKSYWIDGDTMQLVPRDVPEPEPKPGTVLVRMKAVALNRGEFIAGHGLHSRGSVKPAGYEGAGEIVAVGAGVAGLAVGDRVMGRCEASFAEVARMQAAEAVKIPATLDWRHAAGAGITYLTAFDALVVDGLCRPGDWAVLTGASSGVGVACIQIARALGFRTFGTTATTAKLERLKALGMDAGVASRAPDFAPAVLEATGGKGARVAVNSVGGTVFDACIQSLAYRGTLIVVGYVDHMVTPAFDLMTVHAKRLRVIGISTKMRSPEERAETVAGFAQVVLPKMVDGTIVPLVDRVFAFDDLPAAREYMERGEHIGKIVATL
jgi:NADPH:quinone reductase-like Zn-dependent oxidoreductase